MRLALMAHSLNIAPLWMAVEQGFFAAQGVAAEVMVRADIQNVEAVLSGEADFGGSTEGVFEKAFAGERGLKIIVQVVENPLHLIVAPAEVGRLEDLRGAALMTPARGAMPEWHAAFLLRQHGLRPGLDVAFPAHQRAYTPEERLTSFTTGQCRGLVSSPPECFALLRAGFRVVADLSQAFFGRASHALVTTERFIRDHPEVVQRLIHGYTACVQAMRTDRPASVAYLMEGWHLQRDLAEECYDRLAHRWVAKLDLASLSREMELFSTSLGRRPIPLAELASTAFAIPTVESATA